MENCNQKNEASPFVNLSARMQGRFGSLAEQIMHEIVSEWGGGVVRVPDMKAMNRLRRNELIKQKHRGNVTETALYFSVSESTVRRVLG